MRVAVHKAVMVARASLLRDLLLEHPDDVIFRSVSSAWPDGDQPYYAPYQLTHAGRVIADHLHTAWPSRPIPRPLLNY